MIPSSGAGFRLKLHRSPQAGVGLICDLRHGAWGMARALLGGAGDRRGEHVTVLVQGCWALTWLCARAVWSYVRAGGDTYTVFVAGVSLAEPPKNSCLRCHSALWSGAKGESLWVEVVGQVAGGLVP